MGRTKQKPASLRPNQPGKNIRCNTFGEAETRLDRLLAKNPDEAYWVWIDGKLLGRVTLTDKVKKELKK